MSTLCTKRDLFADSNAVWTLASGELGCRTELPAISEATVPSAVVVVVAATLTPFRARLKKRLGSIEGRFS